MYRRSFISGLFATGLLPTLPTKPGTRLSQAARDQVGVTTGYDPHYIRIPYPGGDVPRSTGVCADVVVRAGRDGLGLDLQKLVHEDMLRDFAAYPHTWGMTHPDSNIDHRRVLNLEAFWRRTGCELWHSSGAAAGNAFPSPLAPGDILTWRLNARFPHIGIVVADSLLSTRVVHNWGNGAEESSLYIFSPHRAIGHYRWPNA
ncbi:DUF1287 domain-containing protein [Granulicella mallensis]|uniref:DUF1287 domain-containing protein n=1 Tax=Granulicella mallensis (strain ATCC BAA-1857 / DSM 23137 / MP5ACTX8) TaxID=682795 RepID=G8NUZ7_GRAMM|nr:DUF1287 domain-containing protein [Granulicella mallensis]AEU38767.1 protein of unknown function DUF1287 [Granulicella mallensis MP5ACTX8]